MSTLSKLTGADASHNASVLSQNAKQQSQIAGQYGQNSAGIYGNLNNQGAAQVAPYNNNFLSLLAREGSFAGLGNTLLSPNASHGDRTLPGGSGTPSPGTLGANLYPGSSVQGGGGTQPSDPNNPYSLDNNQQQQLNQTIAGVQQQSKAALQSFNQEMANRGETDPQALAAGQRSIQEHFSDLQAKTSVAFYDQIKADKEKSLQAIISQLTGYGTQGLQLQEAAAGGLHGLEQTSLGQQSSLQQQSLQQQNLSNEQFAGLLKLAGFGFGGGFGGAGISPTSPLPADYGQGPDPSLNPNLLLSGSSVDPGYIDPNGLDTGIFGGS